MKKIEIEIPLAVIVGFLIAPFLSAQTTSQDNGHEEVFELSPFSVDAGETEGYRATTTLAGTRLKTQMRDIGSAISVLTEELFDDTGATDAASVLSYALNAEVSGAQGNFAGNSYNTSGTSNENALRSNPQSNGQRVRGLAEASLTRSYFLTDIPFDSYNTNQVTINRGANSLLFGMGSPGGIIDNSLKQASISSDFGEISLRMGERSSYRGSFDYNKAFVENRLAIRISALKEKANFQQKPAFEEDDRIYVSLAAILAENESSDFLGQTVLRSNFESGNINSNPVAVIPPSDGLTSWFELPNVAGIEAATGKTFGEGAEGYLAYTKDGSWTPKMTVPFQLDGTSFKTEGFSIRPTFFFGAAMYYPNSNSSMLGVGTAGLEGVQGRVDYGKTFGGVQADRKGWHETHWTAPYQGESATPGFRVPVVMNRNIFDNQNRLLTGNTGIVDQDFDAKNLTLEQSFLNGKAGLELSYDQQSYTNYNSLPFTGNRDYSLRVDVSERISYQDLPNPNLGRVMATTGGTGLSSQSWKDREAYRATAFWELDFTQNSDGVNWLGRHVLTGFYNEQEIETKSMNRVGKLTNGDFDFHGIVTKKNLAHGRGNATSVVYLTDSILGATSVNDVRVQNVINVGRPTVGSQFTTSYFNPSTKTHETGLVKYTDILTGGDMGLKNIDSNVFSVQSFLFGGNVVGLAGWRKDSLEIRGIANNAILADGTFDPANFAIGNDVDYSVSGDTFTWSLVGHVPAELPGNTRLSVHIGESENFAPSGIRRNALGDLLSPPSGTTKEYGFTLEFFESKLITKFNWYETHSSNAQANDLNDAVNKLTLGGGGQGLKTALLGFHDADGELPIEDALESAGIPAGAFSSYDEIIDALVNSQPAALRDLINFRFDENGNLATNNISGSFVATNSYVSEGLEIDVVANPVPNWRLGMNIAQQQTVQSGTAPVAAEVAKITQANLIAAGLWEVFDRPKNPVWLIRDRFGRDALLPIAAAQAKDNNISAEQREWRANLFTNYNFSEGSLKGFGVGGALRWQSGIATGYTLTVDGDGNQIPDLANPFMGDSELNGDIWFSYRHKIMKDRYDWKVQLNVRNLIGTQDYIPVFTNPDGGLAIVRNPNPREIFLTNTITF